MALLGLIPSTTRADRFQMKTGESYVGHAERDGVIAGTFDGVKRTLFRFTRADHQEHGVGSAAWESFRLEQPKKGSFTSGQMPAVLVGVTTEPWDEFGRRIIRFSPPRNAARINQVTQALIEIGPKASRLRGVESYWTGQITTSQIPRPVIVGLLNRIPPEEKEERLRAVRFYLQAGWFPEAKAALTSLRKDAPELADNLATAERGVQEAEISARLDEIAVRLAAGHPTSTIKTDLAEIVTASATMSDVLKTRATEALDQLNASMEARTRRQRDLQSAFDGSHSGGSGAGPGAKHLAAMIESLDRCPTKVEALFEPFDRYLKNPDGVDPKKAWSLALSSWVAGTAMATEDISMSLALADTSEIIAKGAYATGTSERAAAAESLQAILIPAEGGDRPLSPKEAQAIAERIRPSSKSIDPTPEKPLIYRVENDTNVVHSEYRVTVPPGYHRLGQFPAVVVLNPGGEPQSAAEPWLAEAALRGWIVIAPDLQDSGAYHYSTDEHATVTLCLRDALKRLAIDPDRVFVAGTAGGGDMAWDYALAHPDSLAGAVVHSGLPAKFVPAYKANNQIVPLYIVEGELAPGEKQVIMPFVKSQMLKNWDATYVQYYKRGLEMFPEEIPASFDWMNGRRRAVDPEEFAVVSGREGDQRFHGLVIQEFADGRSMNPDAVDPMGENLRPASIKARYLPASNQVQLTSDGIRALDVWLSPRQFDFSKKVEIKLGGRTKFKGDAAANWVDFFEDLAARGDTRQTYFMKVELR
jgi:pimeloyl-ACP methyl ester carboxylesterase